MTKAVTLLGTALLLAAIQPAAALDADAKRGAQFFESQHCNTCHAIGAGRGAPNLTRILDREYTPAALTARMWNHAPAMWAAMSRAQIQPPQVSEQQAADLFAFLYAARYFEKPGDAGRGRKAFTEKHCAECHAVGRSSATAGPPVKQWRSVSDPIALVDHMWNHVPRMKAEFAKRNLKWPEVTSQDLTDILVYLRNLPDMRAAAPEFLLPPEQNGEQLFQSKGCTGCHQGLLSLESRLQNKTLTEIAASLWNHSPKMKQPADQISYEEMRQLLGYLWSTQFFSPAGNIERAKRVFDGKRCSTCHQTIPQLTSLQSFVSALWKHGPKMQATMDAKGFDWPVLTAQEVTSLLQPAKK